MSNAALLARASFVFKWRIRTVFHHYQPGITQFIIFSGVQFLKIFKESSRRKPKYNGLGAGMKRLVLWLFITKIKISTALRTQQNIVYINVSFTLQNLTHKFPLNVYLGGSIFLSLFFKQYFAPISTWSDGK
ncbi:uncharacterized protein VICG_00232 [Vittaforma corneae ATCC 50505]|uniref:Uncharacterized protein n=1 Tax=Vittaforma corneae (strain ATCC 50505) TaxID=993615 RepID=L2GRF9_VITCO|nr:uncharacterized protein VICG_00232 [Vittaforma corneae ATCC 50505]ELA42917.1 hypothetical protein VICG_00232 [Vittaforma corneae ATCC 50505]